MHDFVQKKTLACYVSMLLFCSSTHDICMHNSGRRLHWHGEPAQGVSLPVMPLKLASLTAGLNSLTSQSGAVILAITAVTVSI